MSIGIEERPQPFNGDIRSLVLEGSDLQPKDVHVGDTLSHKRGTLTVEEIGKNGLGYPTYTGIFTPNYGSKQPRRETIGWGQLRYYEKSLVE